MTKRAWGLFFSIFFIFLLSNLSGYAANLTYVSDLISSSEFSVGVDHVISFTVLSDIPAGGRIIITPETGAFNIPSGMDHTDLDFMVAQTPSVYVDRSVGTTPTVSEDGIVITTGTSGSLVINLSTSVGLSAGNQVRILAGSNAGYQFSGDKQIINPSAEGSYKIDIRTEDNTWSVIGTSRAYIAIVSPVAVTGQLNDGAPVMLNGSPAGAFSHTVSAIEMWLQTNETANCKYSTIPNESYASMPNIFSNTDDTLHRTVLSGLSAGTSYDYYVKCVDSSSHETPNDLNISFNIKSVPLAGSVSGPVGNPDGSGGPPFIVVDSHSGQTYPPDKAGLVFDGYAYPNSKVYVLKDGVSVGMVQTNNDSKFNFNLTDIGRGIYTFGFYALDPEGNKSNTANTTFSVTSNTGNQISNIKLAPTVKIDKNINTADSSIIVTGFSLMTSSVQLEIYNEGGSSGLVKKMFTRSDASGRWTASIETGTMSEGSYRLRSRSAVTEFEMTGFSQNQFFSIGTSDTTPKVELEGDASDFNNDSKINLVDFSILLFNWGGVGEGTASDINQDDTVNLTDFSILLFNWTG